MPRYTTIFEGGANCTSYKMLIRTDTNAWQDTMRPCIIPISIHSAFMTKPLAIERIAALAKLVGSYANKTLILLCENAHIHTISLLYKGLETAEHHTLKYANKIKTVLSHLLPTLDITLWREFVEQNNRYHYWLTEITELYQKDSTFQGLVLQQAQQSYQAKRQSQHTNAEQFITQAIKDYLAHCTSTMIAIEEGFHYEFYMSSLPQNIAYTMQHFERSGQISRKLTWINVSLHTPKKL